MTDMIGKRQLNKARKREAIVQVATRAFLENGYAATSMSAIADELGGSKATLWAHFSSKEELFAAVIDG
jgi:AcrR family transcriptional regulator